MKLSIWQQFSNNHSADYTVVGEFESVWLAEQAEKKLRKILGRIEDWWNKLTPEAWWEWVEITDTAQLTPIEQKLQKELRVDWPYSLNWYHAHRDFDPVYSDQTLVIVTPPYPFYWNGPQPFNELLAKFGAKVAVDVDESRTHPNAMLLMDVRCTLPQLEESATLLYESFKEDFEAIRKRGWGTYEADYTPNIDIVFNVDYARVITESIERGTFEVEKDQTHLFLWGIGIEAGGHHLGEEIRIIREYLEGEGCTDVIVSFRTLTDCRWED